MYSSTYFMLRTFFSNSCSCSLQKIILSLFLVAAPAVVSAAPLSVSVSILPQKYFVEQIAGNRAEVMVMVRPGASPATYEPRPRQMRRLESGDLYFAIGAPFERTWLPKIAALNPNLPIVHTEDGIQRIPMEEHDHDDHHTHKAHKETQAHARELEIPDPHIWLAPKLVAVQAKNILRGLQQVDPGHADEYKRNCDRFLSSIADTDRKISDILAAIPEHERTFMVFHPSWGYFARAYDLRQIPIESEGKEPGPRQLAKIIDQGKELNIRAVFVQKQFSSKSAELIARGMGARVVALDPLAENWEENLIKAAKAIATALKND